MKPAARHHEAILSGKMPFDHSLRVLADTGSVISAEMSIDEWLAMAPHPRHRPMGGQAVRAHWAWVRRTQGAALQSFRQVVAAEFGDTLYKVDGHARTALWAAGEVPLPPSVFVQIHRTEAREEFNRVYQTFNAPHSEPQYDKVAVAMRAHGLRLSSKRLRYGYILNALNIALRGTPRAHQDKTRLPPIDVHRAVGVFKHELTLLDSVDPRPEVFYNGVIAAALIALSLDAERHVGFFAKLSMREGNKVDGRMDPVEAVLDIVAQLKHQRAAWISAAQHDLCGRVLRACLAWHRYAPSSDHFWFRTRIRAMDIRPLIQAMKERKGIADDPEL